MYSMCPQLTGANQHWAALPGLRANGCKSFSPVNISILNCWSHFVRSVLQQHHACSNLNQHHPFQRLEQTSNVLPVSAQLEAVVLQLPSHHSGASAVVSRAHRGLLSKDWEGNMTTKVLDCMYVIYSPFVSFCKPGRFIQMISFPSSHHAEVGSAKTTRSFYGPQCITVVHTW